MGTPPRDPLAEHPLGGDTEASPRKGRGGRTLELFPDVGQTVLNGSAPATPVAGAARAEAPSRRASAPSPGPAPESIEDAGEPLAAGAFVREDAENGDGGAR